MIPYKERKENKKNQIQSMFNHIAPRYDFLNHFFSMGLDKYWRRKSTKILKKHTSKNPKILDLATGTGAWVKDLLTMNASGIIGADIAEDMLSVARNKFYHHPSEDIIKFQAEDAENLSFEDNQFDLVTIGFGVRNFENIRKGIAEIYRVLKSDGIIAILELTTPKKFPMKQCYMLYSKTLIPFLGKIVSKDRGAYSYLPESIEEFSKTIDLATIMKEERFIDIQIKPMSFGIVTLYFGKKQKTTQ